MIATLGGGSPDLLYRAGPVETLPMTYWNPSGTCVLQSATSVDMSPIQPLQPSDFVAVHERIVRHGRLGYVVQTGDDGSEMKTGLYDSVRGEDCTWVPFGADQARCLPDHETTGRLYADAACTQPVVETQGPPPRVILAGGAACGSAPSVYAVGDPVTTLYFLDDLNQCGSAMTNPAFTIFSIGAEIPADAFASATRAPFAVSPRIQMAHWLGPDGVTTQIGLWDTSKNAPCTIAPVNGATNVESCAPEQIVPYAGFNDSQCTMGIGALVTQSCSSWIAGYEASAAPRTCAGSPSFVYLYDTVVPPPVYKFQPDCAAFPSGIPVYSRSPTPVDPLSLVSFGFATQ